MNAGVAVTTLEPGAVLAGARDEGRTRLLEHEVYALLHAAGFAVPRHIMWNGAPGDRLPADVLSLLAEVPGDQVVLKIVAAEILHKSDVGGVAFAARTPPALLEAAARMWRETGERAPEADRRGILVLERLSPLPGTAAAEVLVSFKQDAAFGPVLVLGLGGILTEWYGSLSGGASTVILRPGRVEAGLRDAARTSPAFALLFSPSRIHAAAPLSLDRVAERLESLARLGAGFGPGSGEATALEEIEVNPVVLTTDGRWVAADGKARLSDRRVVETRRPLAKIGKLLAPRSAVVIGASSSGMNPGRIILKNLKASEGIAYGRLHAVHPTEAAIEGVPCVPSVAALPGPVDLAVVAVPARGARDVIRELCATERAQAIILIPGGFAETGDEALEQDIRGDLAASRSLPGGGPVLVGGNCLGVVSKHEYNTFFLPQYKLPFHDAPGESLVAVSQSGAYLVSLTSNLDGIVFPRASISYGNQMDLGAADFLEYFEADPSVRVLAFYIEGFAPLDGERFVRAAERMRGSGRRIIVFKAGKTALGAQAAQSHTASLAGDYAVARSLLEGAGVLVAQTLDMFEDFTKIFTMLGGRPAGPRLAVLSNAGFECSAVLDKLYGLVPATLSASTKERLTRCLPSIAHADNPIDATPMATTRQFVEAAEALLADPDVDALLVSPIPVTPTLDNLAPDLSGVHTENIFSPGSLPQELLRLFRGTPKPMVVNVDSGRLYDDFVMVLQRGGIPVYRKIDRASRALAALAGRSGA